MAVIADVFEALLVDADGDVVATSTLQDANIDVTVTENDVRSGRGNQLTGVLHSDRDIAVAMNDMGFKFDWMAKQFGQDIVTGAGYAYSMPKWYVAVDNAGATEITLEETPDTDHDLAIYNEEGVKVTGFTVSGNKVILTSATPIVAIGEDIEVRTYKYVTSAQTQEFKIDNSVFAKGVKLILETVEVDESTETVTHKIQYEFPNALPTGAFTINTASERSAQAQSFNLRIVKPKTSTEVGTVKRIPVV